MDTNTLHFFQLLPTINDDILWRIFSLIHIPDSYFKAPHVQIDKTDESLINARRFSQVCSQWRRVILSASSIWANTINFQHLEQLSDTWRSVVLERTGLSPLSVVYHEMSQFSSGKSFFLSMIRDNWHRIKRISLSTRILRKFKDDERWNIFAHPSPTLEICNITFGFSPPAAFHRNSQQHFPNILPALRVLQVDNIFFHPNSHVTQIESLTLSNCTVRNDLIMALSSMMALKRLHIQYFEIWDSGANYSLLRDLELRKVKLHSLMDLQISTNSIEFVICVLNQITPSPTRALKFNLKTFNTPWEVPFTYLSSGIQANLSTFLCGSDLLTLMLLQNKIGINVDLEYPTEPRGPNFLFDLDLDGPSRMAFESTIVTSLSAYDLSSIRSLRLYIPANSSRAPEYDFMNRYFYKFATESLGNVETVITSTKPFFVISMVQNMTRDAIHIFPSIRAILFDDGENVSDDIITFAIEKFIDTRANRANIRIGKLGIPVMISGEWNASFLEEFDVNLSVQEGV